MNSPCPDCNFYNWRILNAWLNRDYSDLRYWHKQKEAHEKDCIVINGDWYKGLWSHAQIGVDIYPEAHWVREVG